MDLRYAVAEDAAEIVNLIQAHASVGGWHSPLTADYIATYLASPASKILLAIENGRPVGLLSYSTRPDLFHAGTCCFIEELVVAEEKRGQGIGSLLLKAVLDDARQSGWPEVSLSVLPQNSGAQRLYRQLGFVEESVLLEQHFLG